MMLPTALTTGSLVATATLVPFTKNYIAMRTAIDTAQLVSRWRDLLVNTDLRRKMGQNAKVRIINEFVWSKVIRQFGELWTNQISIANMETCEYEPLDLRSTFSHYASAPFYGEPVFLKASRSSINELEIRVAPNDQRLVVVRRCYEKPCLLDELLRIADMETITTLMKKGLLQIRGRVFSTGSELI